MQENSAQRGGSVGPYHSLRVARVIDETHDARSFELDIPKELAETFAYRAGQFLTFRVAVDGHRLVRCYSLASSPETDRLPKFTVKRVDEGRVSNRLNDALEVGSTLEVMKPAGLFCLQGRDSRILLFSGGSGITPVISIIKTALESTTRSLRLFYANRDANSVIFDQELRTLVERHPERLEVVHRLDDTDGFASSETIRPHIGDDTEADFYVCGPGPFMDVVEQSLAELSIPADQIFIERFVYAEDDAVEGTGGADTTAPTAAAGQGVTVSITLDGSTREIAVAEGETILAAALREGLDAPFACREGYCGCCMASVLEGDVEMKVNDALDANEVEAGWVLTCQGLAKSSHCKIEYPD